MNEEHKRRPGRPIKDKADPLKGNVTFRTRHGLRLQIIAAAQASGRSMSEEIEFRVRRDFEREAQSEDVLRECRDILADVRTMLAERMKP